MESAIREICARKITNYTGILAQLYILELQITMHDDITSSTDALVIAWANYSHKMGPSRDLKSQKFQVESSFEN